MRRFFVVLVVVAGIAGLAACDPAKQVSAVGGTGQIEVVTAPNATIALYRDGVLVPTLSLAGTGDPTSVNSRKTDAYGRVTLRYVAPGSGYVVKRIDSTATKPSAPVTVHSLTTRPAASTYTKQQLTIGYGYLATRDGTLLSTMVRLPGPADKGPYPTVVEYSGYDPSNPDWSGTTASTRILNLLGYATVGVNIRGTGCSGGSFQLWEDTQRTDGYDAVEAVAAQPWVLNHKVGLVGLSYPGIAALYAASTQPPSLAAVAVAGTYDDGFRDLMRPAGILNTGFARSWVQGRESEAQANGQAWVAKRVAAGDAVCKFNQQSRTQNVLLGPRIDAAAYYPTVLGIGRAFSPAALVSKISAPTFVAASWQDEQVGGHMPTMIPNFTGTNVKRFVLTNGGHAETFAVPEIIARWDEFLDLYVKRQAPKAEALKDLAPYIRQQVIGGPATPQPVPFPADRFPGKTYAQAKAAYEAEKPVHVVFENGGGSGGVEPGLPQGTFSRDVAAYPVPGTTVSRWYLGADGTLSSTAPTAADDDAGSIDSYVSDPAARPRTSTTGGSDWAQSPAYNWAPPVDGKSLTYATPPLASTTTMIGSASADLWIRSTAPDTDLQVTLTEVRPDGKEVYVQSGWLRASVRRLDLTRSTELQPQPTMLAADANPLVAGKFSRIRLEIYPFAHVFRAGSRVRIIVTAPGGDRMQWAFDQPLPGTPTNEIAHSVGRVSSLALPVVSGMNPPAALPACPGLRGQPCRTAPTTFAN